MKTASLILAVMVMLLLVGCIQTVPSEENKTNATSPPPGLLNATPPRQPQNITPSTNATPPTNETGNVTNIGNTIPPEEYNPAINAADFSSNVTNPFFTLAPRKKMVYKAQTEDGYERNEFYVTNNTRLVQGVETIIVWDRVWLNDELVEDTRDWYAQDREGNVWYFGEDSKEMIGGKVASTAGSWEAGINGAKSGIIMKANPVVNDSYRQEYYAGEAEDMANVLALGETVSVPAGNYTGCLMTLDWTPLEPGTDENKYYCPQVGGVVLEVVEESGEKNELISVEYGAAPSPSVASAPEGLNASITEDEAKEIAIGRVPGKVTDVEIERKFGKIAYVVQVDADRGPETDVIIDIETGEVLAVET